jgi:hypothetical protein
MASKLNDLDGVTVRPTSTGRVAILIPVDYLDDPMFPRRPGAAPDLALVLDLPDARKLARALGEFCPEESDSAPETRF